MPDSQDLEDLERTIEERRAAASRPPAGDEQQELAELALTLEELAQTGPEFDDQAVWAKVVDFIETTPQRGGVSGWISGWTAGAWAWLGGVPARPLLAPAAIASVLVIGALAFLVLQSPQSASAAFLDDVRDLSALTDEALDDAELTDDEIAELSGQTDLLLAAIAGDDGALDDLDDVELSEVITALVEAASRLEAQLGGDDGRVAVILGQLGLISGSAGEALAAHAIDGAAAACDGADDDDALEACDDALDAADEASDDLDDEAEEACEDELDEIADSSDAKRSDDDEDGDDRHDEDRDGDDRDDEDGDDRDDEDDGHRDDEDDGDRDRRGQRRPPRHRRRQ